MHRLELLKEERLGLVGARNHRAVDGAWGKDMMMRMMMMVVARNHSAVDGAWGKT